MSKNIRPHADTALHMDYPTNLFHILVVGHSAPFPNKISCDQLAGFAYAMSTLPEASRQWIRMRFQEGLSSEETAEALGLCLEEEKQLGGDTLRKLRHTSRRDWILYGIEGNTKRLLEQSRTDSYRQGYREGLEDGLRGKKWDAPASATLALPIRSLPLSPRILNALERAGFSILEELAALDENKIMAIQGLGARGADRVDRVLTEMGINGTAWDQFWGHFN